MSKIIKAENLVFVQASVKDKVCSGINNPTNDLENFYQEAKMMVEELIIEAKAKAEKILHEAEDEAANILERAQKEGENLKSQAYTEGYHLGKEDGLKEVQVLKKQANEIIEKAYEERIKILENMEREIVDFSVNIAEKIIRQQIENNQEIALPIVQDLLAHVQDSTQVTVKVGEADYEDLINQVDTLQSFLNYGSLNLELDNTLKQGDCIVVSENGIVVAKIDEQFEKLKKMLQDGIHSD